MKKKVLFIEDDQVFANAYRNKLLLDGFEAEVAYDAETGLELIKQFRPDALLLDLILPKLTGVEVIQKVRNIPEFKNLPIIVLSNTYLTNMVQDAWKAGATKCLSKAGSSPGQVIRAFHKLLDQKAPSGVVAPVVPESEANLVSEEPPAEFSDSDAAFQADLRREFEAQWPATLAQLRSALQNTVRAEGEALRLQQVYQLYRKVHALTGNASIVGMVRIAQLASAAEALLKELHDKPKNLNASSLRTVAAAVDFFGMLFNAKPVAPARDISVLVVDDEAISRRAITYALEKVKMNPVTVADPLQALQMLPGRNFDLIFLDVDMPNMSGYELCSRLRSLPALKKTPVVFVTSLNDLESRANSTMSGGNDFIAKPFLFMELAVKALVQVMRGELEPARPS